MPPEAEWARMAVERQCSHLTRPIDDLMDVSRISSGKIRLQCEVFDIQNYGRDRTGESSHETAARTYC
jgi:K+-sensing histidine kinase KdpD